MSQSTGCTPAPAHFVHIHLSKRALALLALVLSASFNAGCGGGGGDGGTAGPSSGYVAPVERQAITAVPAPVYTDQRRTDAFNRLNEIRLAAGVGLLTQHSAVDQAAQAHTEYQLINGELGHAENIGTPGYTGSTSIERNKHFGYNDVVDTAEVTLSLSATTLSAGSSTTGAKIINALMSGPYHRDPILRAEYFNAGIGFLTIGQETVATVNFARSASNLQGAPKTAMVIWPPSGSTDVPTTMLREIPDPIPENGGAAAGYAVSVQISRLFGTLDVETFELRETISGQRLAVKIINYKSDAHLSADLFDSAFVAAIPRSPLLPNTRYTAFFKGKKNISEGEVAELEKSWEFTTGSGGFF